MTRLNSMKIRELLVQACREVVNSSNFVSSAETRAEIRANLPYADWDCDESGVGILADGFARFVELLEDTE